MITKNKLEEPRKYTQGKERNHFNYFKKYKEMLEPTKEEIERAKGPSTWDIIYDDMSPYEKGSWNAQQRKKGMDGKTAMPLEDVKKKKPIEPVKIDFNIGPSLRVAKKPKPKPQYINGNVIDLKPLLHDPWWQIKPEKPEDEETKIKSGLAYLLQA